LQLVAKGIGHIHTIDFRNNSVIPVAITISNSHSWHQSQWFGRS